MDRMRVKNWIWFSFPSLKFGPDVLKDYCVWVNPTLRLSYGMNVVGVPRKVIVRLCVGLIFIGSEKKGYIVFVVY